MTDSPRTRDEDIAALVSSGFDAATAEQMTDTFRRNAQLLSDKEIRNLARSRSNAVAELTRDGFTDSATATRIVDALATVDRTPTNLPDQDHDVFAVMVRLAPAERGLLAEIYTKASRTGSCPRYVERTLADMDNAEQIDQARKVLTDQLAALEAAHRAVAGAVDKLIDLYDVEYAESGTLFHHWVEQTGIAIRTTVALNPTPEQPR